MGLSQVNSRAVRSVPESDSTVDVAAGSGLHRRSPNRIFERRADDDI
jgi:hypothetical protein